MQVGHALYKSVLWRGLQYLLTFVLNILIARHFLAAVSGNIYYISSIYSLVVLFAGFSIESGIVYFAANDKIAMGKLLNFALVWSLLTGLLVGCIVYFLGKGPGNAGIDNFVLVSSITFICGNLLIAYCSGLFYAKKDFVTPNVISLVINLSLIILFPFEGHSIVPILSGNNFFYAYFISFFVQGILLAVAVQGRYLRFRFAGFLPMADWRALIRYCAMAYLANIIFFLLYRVDYWFVERYCSAEDLGNYIQVSKLAQLFFILPTILASAVFPLTAGGQREAVNRILGLVARTILFLYLVSCGVLALCGNWLFPFVFGKSFTGMYQPFLLLIPGILSLSGLFIVTAYYAGKDRMMVNIKGSLLAFIVIVISDRIFIPVYGIHAAALVSSAGYIVYQLYVLSVFKKEYGTAISNFFIFRISDWKELKNNLARSTNLKDANQQ